MGGWTVTRSERWPTVQHVVPDDDHVEHDTESFGALRAATGGGSAAAG